MNLREAAGRIGSLSSSRIIYKGEPGRIIGVGPKFVNISLDSEVERWRKERTPASPQYLSVLPEDLEFEDA